jgi:hypothetical protein
MRVLIVQIAVCSVLAAALWATPASAAPERKGPTLVVANPSPGDMLTPGALVMQGVAFDDDAEHGLGVDRVSVFLDEREAGGLYLGDASLGSSSNMVTSDPQFADGGWRLTTPALKGDGQNHEIWVYTRSAVNGAETVIRIPVTIGEHVQRDRGAGGEEGGPED